MGIWQPADQQAAQNRRGRVVLGRNSRVADTLAAGGAGGTFADRSTADVIAASARMGWMPSYPTFDRNPLELTRAAEEAGRAPADYVVDELKAGRLHFAGQDPDAPQNYPMVLT